jgi:hypothetical protein
MKSPPLLADLPLLPRDESGPVFAEPWQAQAFAVVVGLTEAGKISTKEWADHLDPRGRPPSARGAARRLKRARPSRDSLSRWTR